MSRDLLTVRRVEPPEVRVVLVLFVGLEVLKDILDADAITEFSVRLEAESDRVAAKAALADALPELEVKDWQELEPQAAAMLVMG